MQKLIKENGLITWIKPEKFGFTQREGLELIGHEIIDENTIHVEFLNLGIFCFLVDDTELNGIVYKNSEELINNLK